MVYPLLAQASQQAAAIGSASAAPHVNQLTDANSLIVRATSFGNVAIYLLIALAVVYIVYGVVQYIIKPDSSDRHAAMMNIVWGCVGLAVIVSIWGLVNILVGTFGTSNNQVNCQSLPSADFFNGTPQGDCGTAQ